METWGPILAGLITGLLALVGVLIAQVVTTRRERSAWRINAASAAHVDFLREQQRLSKWAVLVTRVGEPSQPDLTPAWDAELLRLLVPVQIFGSTDAANAALKLVEMTQKLTSGAIGDMMRAELAVERYRTAVQEDLGIPVTALRNWATEHGRQLDLG